MRDSEGMQQRLLVQTPQVRGRYRCAVEHPAKVILTGSWGRMVRWHFFPLWITEAEPVLLHHEISALLLDFQYRGIMHSPKEKNKTNCACFFQMNYIIISEFLDNYVIIMSCHHHIPTCSVALAQNSKIIIFFLKIWR